jgi:hypothetical protein
VSAKQELRELVESLDEDRAKVWLKEFGVDLDELREWDAGTGSDIRHIDA